VEKVAAPDGTRCNVLIKRYESGRPMILLTDDRGDVLYVATIPNPGTALPKNETVVRAEFVAPLVAAGVVEVTGLRLVGRNEAEVCRVLAQSDEES
jgi:hypothetical protein